MNRKVLVIAVALMAVAMLAVPMSAVYATKPMPVSGTFMVFPDGDLIIRQAGNSHNTIWILSGTTVMWTGDIEGIASYESRWVAHSHDDPEKFGINTRTLYTIEATVDEKCGTLYIEAIALGPSGPHKWVIIGGTGELANLHGQGTFRDDTTTPYPFDYLYSGQVHFDP